MDGKEVKLHGYWASPLALRVIWSLKIKGVDITLFTKRFLSLSTVTIAESLVIMEYIDETWKQNPLLPEDPCERAKARFWAKFVDEKCIPANIRVFCSTGEEQQKALTEVRENWKLMESGIEGKRFFGGKLIGFADVANAWNITVATFGTTTTSATSES
ncbi:hypothetical protein Ancab_038355 [Ancistrocladus abbreviatus]